MSERAAEERALAWIGALLIGAALVGNELVLARVLSSDGAFEGSTLLALRAFGLACVGAGVAVIAWRRRLVELCARFDPFRDARGRPDALEVILWIGIVLRVVVFLALYPENNDPHWEFIRFIVDEGRLPIATEVTLGFQPPLYYLLAAPFALVSMKATQALSLALAIANLVLLHRILRDTRLLKTYAARCHALLFCAVLPQFVLFSLFVSNDALAFPLGTLLALLAFRYVEHPSRRGLVALGVTQGAALLAKGTLIGNAPVIALAVGLVHWRRGGGMREAIVRCAALTAIVSAVGCYKFVENQVHFGTPVISNDIIHQAWVKDQQGTVQGLSSYVDGNVVKLARQPFVDESTLHSIPLLYYGTFWGAYIQESSFVATRSHPWKAIPRALYLAAAVPTLLLLLGLATRVRRNLDLAWLRTADPERLQELVAILFLAGAVALVTKWGIKHDAWSFFQARLVFPAFLGIALGLGWGCESVQRRALARYGSNLALAAAYALMAAYYGVEIAASFSG